MKRSSLMVRALVFGLPVLLVVFSLSLAGCGSDQAPAETTPTVSVKLIVPTAVPTEVPKPSPTPPETSGATGTTYTVKSGDTLSKIAADFGVSVDSIVKANKIADPNLLTVGQELVIPPKGEATPEVESSGEDSTPAAASSKATPTP
ncbi:MAG: LysM peptidoglycan-binding domain-containing protein [Chloroflexi bacterium]|nr:LysM peptidoglycan-binding domain-containing protein [Chloroflexota bacterium]